jgi:DNA-binding transcriptional regulator YiaG
MSKVLIPVPEDLEQVLKPVLERDPDKGAELLRAGFEAPLAELYQQRQALRISTSRFAELLGVSRWELADLLRAHGWKTTNLPG